MNLRKYGGHLFSQFVVINPPQSTDENGGICDAIHDDRAQKDVGQFLDCPRPYADFLR
jgi:hypothetical protein